METCLSVLFVLPKHCKDESQVSEIMSQAYDYCKQHIANVSWMKETEIISKDCSKSEYIIFEQFEGEAFEKVSKSSSTRILGPWCLSVCLSTGRNIPNVNWPIYNVALVDCTITCSHMSKEAKDTIRDLVQKMGGSYVDKLLTKTTHLITESVKSEKYSLAVEGKLNIMLPNWINAVWEASQSGNVNGDDTQFAKYRCPIFHKLVICSTGFTRDNVKERNELRAAIVENGGTFAGSMVINKTDILIVYGTLGRSSEKFKAARKHDHIKCVSIDWVMDSLKKGCLVSYEDYKIKPHTSTPEKDVPGPDFSMMSAISRSVCQKSTIEDTINVTTKKSPPKKRKGSLVTEFGNIIDGLDIKKAKLAGQYLDGCSVYIAGFEGDQKEKLIKILNLSGAIRYDDMSERITHVIVGDPSSPELKLVRLKKYPAFLVTIHWLIESMQIRYPVDEQKYIVSVDALSSEMGSPLGKKGLNLLRSKNVLTESDMQMADLTTSNLGRDEPEECVMQQYSSVDKGKENDVLGELLDIAGSVESRNEVHNVNSTGEQNELFKNLTFALTHFDSVPHREQVRELVESEGGVVVNNHKGVTDFVVTPNFINSRVDLTASEIVNEGWIIECSEEKYLIEFEYYHRPMMVKSDETLRDCVCTISGYTGYERSFLLVLITALGGTAQDQFARISRPEMNIVGSTHLISSEASGRKYNAARKWNKPVVNKDWLMESARLGVKAPEEDFFVGNPSSSSSVVDSRMGSGNESSVASKGAVSRIRESSFSDDVFYNPNENSTSKAIPESVKIVDNVKSGASGSDSPRTPVQQKKCWLDMDTPETPLGRLITPNPSKELRKLIAYKIDQFPDYVPPKRRLSTPMSELKRRFRDRLFQKYDNMVNMENVGEGNVEQDGPATTDDDLDKEEAGPSHMNSQDMLVDKKLSEINDLLTNSGGKRKHSTNFQQLDHSCVSKESQPLTVEWDFSKTIQTPPGQKLRIFTLSGVENDKRQVLISQLESLGGVVSNLSSYDPACTHLLSPNPGRNEKTLSFMAAGKWLLHSCYVEECVKAGKFLDEEEFEFGNPKAKKCRKFTGDNQRAEAMHWWRKEIKRRGYGAFNDMRALVVATKRDSITRVIEAGGGVIVDVKPPYVDTVHATHCLLEPKCVSDYSIYKPLHAQGIHCVNTLYISDYLYRTCSDIKESILPAFL